MKEVSSEVRHTEGASAKVKWPVIAFVLFDVEVSAQYSSRTHLTVDLQSFTLSLNLIQINYHKLIDRSAIIVYKVSNKTISIYKFKQHRYMMTPKHPTLHSQIALQYTMKASLSQFC